MAQSKNVASMATQNKSYSLLYKSTGGDMYELMQNDGFP